MRVGILPRETASAVITGAMSVTGWAVAAVIVLLTVPVLVETLIIRERASDLPLALLLLGVVLGGVAAVAVRPRRWVVLLFLAGAGLAGMGYEVLLLTSDPGLIAASPYLVNRPSLVLVMVGIPASRPLIGIAWTLVGFAVSLVVGLVSFAIVGLPYAPGFGPIIVLGVSTIVYLTVAAIQGRIRKSVPNFDDLEAETLSIAHGEDLARLTTAVVHDTLLNDLAVVMNAPERLDDVARQRLLADLETVRGADWITATARTPTPGDGDRELRHELARIATEFQWRGLSMHLTSAPSARFQVTAEVTEALLAAVRASLENVVRHSGATTAELEVIAEAGSVTVMVTDPGSGFDLGSVAGDRLGLRASVIARMAAVGGTAKIWSAPGEGTSVVISAPATRGVPA
ncbi:MAG: ATP-binding protein [Pseudolysinimonas sp.]|uniref:sensor histidine kinase n=1 Tax=Pseudolysinimonas sp. TaxID=2680009 RepID=UPI003267C3E6